MWYAEERIYGTFSKPKEPIYVTEDDKGLGHPDSTINQILSDISKTNNSNLFINHQENTAKQFHKLQEGKYEIKTFQSTHESIIQVSLVNFVNGSKTRDIIEPIKIDCYLNSPITISKNKQIDSKLFEDGASIQVDRDVLVIFLQVDKNEENYPCFKLLFTDLLNNGVTDFGDIEEDYEETETKTRLKLYYISFMDESLSLYEKKINPYFQLSQSLFSSFRIVKSNEKIFSVSIDDCIFEYLFKEKQLQNDIRVQTFLSTIDVFETVHPQYGKWKYDVTEDGELREQFVPKIKNIKHLKFNKIMWRQLFSPDLQGLEFDFLKMILKDVCVYFEGFKFIVLSGLTNSRLFGSESFVIELTIDSTKFKFIRVACIDTFRYLQQ